MAIPLWLQVLLIGLAAGWLAALILRERQFGLIGFLVVGVAGSFVGSFLFRLAGFAAQGWFAHLVAATAGALLLIGLLRLFRRGR
jgi:uncharacterized membrane protein YeaQ/YmgE (transglycosylase-associated protein family)